MQIKLRRQAALDGDSKYWTGRPCSKNHDSPRYTTTGICCKCNTEAAKAYNMRMRTAINAKAQGHFSYLLHPDDHAAALAYCQALDMQRGRKPQVGSAPQDPGPFQLPKELADLRQVASGAYAKAAALRAVDPDAAARLFAEGAALKRDEIAKEYGPKSGEPYLPAP